ncbi:hypothetical protein TCAL_10786 [Tigriopus californicus]|uniref:acylaminoacyl-peptidase n=1 Tax=Tigriopus californicus TaxID=6832 RepID=A0A553NFL1_TIGCA|nr:acylamino-acid-releasing enzyme-like [Tigriopus californicus]TRY64188.1 hypothetical protein TCAL_10786 [Tigriopus californicus]|eukprot:TCALIF_10786-PA protein Name:"Similar to Apeh Acylamino-acid-releasing enzyme (Rattus norvegicus)" AED:0.01 eAED:0.01 QI:0/-1/0/1/-1/1/1/0/712
MAKLSSVSLPAVKKAFQASLRVPTLKSASILPQTQTAEAVWQQSCLATGSNVCFTSIHALPGPAASAHTPFGLSPPWPLASGSCLEARCGQRRVIIQKCANDEKKEVWILRVFDRTLLVQSLNLSDRNLHGDVYLDATLGGITLDATGERVAFIAELKAPEGKPFFKYVPSTESKAYQLQGQEFRFKDEFGEQMVGQGRPVIVLVDLKTEEVKLWDESLPSDWCPGQLQFYKDALIGMAVKVEPFRLGLVYCSNRPRVIFKLDLNSGGYQVLSGEANIGAMSPRILKSRDLLVWLERDLVTANGIFPGPHQTCMRVMKRNLSDPEALPQVLVSEIAVQPSETGFSGVYQDCFPPRCFALDKFLVLSASQQSVITPLVVDLETQQIQVLKEHAQTTIVDVQDDYVLGCRSTPTSAPTLVAGIVSQDGQIGFQPLSHERDLIPKLPASTGWDLIELQSGTDSVPFNAIYVGTKSGASGSNEPLIVWPHGGPHSDASSIFVQPSYFFNQLGYNILFVNYRGSLGSGQTSVESLLGKIGRQDVDDCMVALDACLSKYSHLGRDRVVLLGGSHGGFLVTHLAGQFPDRFQAVVARNPVINVSTLATVSDIPDWCFNECGLPFKYQSPTPEMLKKMYEMSPISHVEKVQAPVYLMIGSKDLRVPPSQGYEYYRNLKALGKNVEMNVYEDNHPLGKVSVHANVMVNATLFFDQHLDMKR